MIEFEVYHDRGMTCKSENCRSGCADRTDPPDDAA